MNTTPENMAAETLADVPTRFAWALDDLRDLVSRRPIIAEGWGLRPNLVAPIIDSPHRMVVMVPTQEFRQHQRHQTARASALNHRLSNPQRAQHNQLARDHLVAEDALHSAHRFGIRTIEINSSHALALSLTSWQTTSAPTSRPQTGTALERHGVFRQF